MKIVNKRWIFFLFLQIFMFFSPLVLAGKLAIVIDDIGYRPKEDQEIYNLPNTVSVAIIPSAPYAVERATRAHQQGRDSLIHLPMQPQNAHQPIEKGALTVGMSAQEIQHLIDDAYQKMPNVIGLNNHMGSRATTDEQTMVYLMRALNRHQLAFLDSKTAGNSVAYRIAKKSGVSALARHLFLDDSNELVDVQRQFDRAVDYARKHSVAILIGHPRKHSIAVLKKGIVNLPKEVELVGLSTLWQAQKPQPAKPFIMLFEVEPALTSVAPYQSVPLLRGIPKE